MPRRTKATILIVLLVLLLLALAAYLRRKAPPEAAGCFPNPIASSISISGRCVPTTHFDQHQVPTIPQYQSFIDATGFEFERDLDEVAFGLHRMPNPLGPNGAVAFLRFFSAISTASASTDICGRSPPKPRSMPDTPSTTFPARAGRFA